MIRNDRIRPTQPYMVMDSTDFCQEIYLKQGISHFYSCRIKAETTLRIVPTGCIDIIFIYPENGKSMQVLSQGTFQQFTKKTEHEDVVIFGVRFMPGVHPAFLKYTMKELVDNIKEMPKEALGDRMYNKMSQADSFYERIKIFLQEYTILESGVKKNPGKRELLEYVVNEAYQKQGKVEIATLQDKTGYTTRYINRIFVEEMGFSPKQFCKIIQFQHSIEFLNYGSLAWSYGKMDDNLPTKMTDIATYLGYYDQPQFIRDFKKYAGVTPKKYLEMVSNGKYRSRINSSDLY